MKIEYFVGIFDLSYFKNMILYLSIMRIRVYKEGYS